MTGERGAQGHIMELDHFVNRQDPFDYGLAIKNRGRPPRCWRWEIYEAGKSKAVRQSDFFGTMSEATRAGKAALSELRANSAA